MSTEPPGPEFIAARNAAMAKASSGWAGHDALDPTAGTIGAIHFQLPVESATHAQRAVEIGTTQYRGGRVDFQPVVYMQQILTRRQDELASSRGLVAANLVSIYKALGGGWQTRMGGAGTALDLALIESDVLVEDVLPL